VLEPCGGGEGGLPAKTPRKFAADCLQNNALLWGPSDGGWASPARPWFNGPALHAHVRESHDRFASLSCSVGKTLPSVGRAVADPARGPAAAKRFNPENCDELSIFGHDDATIPDTNRSKAVLDCGIEGRPRIRAFNARRTRRELVRTKLRAINDR